MGTHAMLILQKGDRKKFHMVAANGEPCRFGVEILALIGTNAKDLPEMFDRIVQVEAPGEDPYPTDADIEVCRKFDTIDLDCSTSSENDWYCLTRKAQHKLGLFLEGYPYFFGFEPADPLEIDYLYTLDLDARTIVVMTSVHDAAKREWVYVELLRKGFDELQAKLTMEWALEMDRAEDEAREGAKGAGLT